MSTPSVKASSHRRLLIHPRIAVQSSIPASLSNHPSPHRCPIIHPPIAVCSFIAHSSPLSYRSAHSLRSSPPSALEILRTSHIYLNTINTAITHKWANIIHSSTSKYTIYYQHTTQHIIYIHDTLSTYTTHYQHIRHIIDICDTSSTYTMQHQQW